MNRLLARAIFALSSLTCVAWAGDFVTDRNFLNTYYNRIKVLDSEIQRLVEEKKQSRDPAKFRPILDQISKSYEELHENYTKYLKIRDHMRFEHPEHGEEIERQYHLLKVRSAEDLEGELGIDWKLNKVKTKVDRVYTTLPVHPITADDAEEVVFETTTTTTRPPRPLMTPAPEKPRPKLSL